MAFVHLCKAKCICIYVTRLLTNQNLFRDWWSYYEKQMHQSVFQSLCLCYLFCAHCSAEMYSQKCFKIYSIFVRTMQQCWHCHLLTDNENAASSLFLMMSNHNLTDNFPSTSIALYHKKFSLCRNSGNNSVNQHICLLFCGTWCLIVFIKYLCCIQFTLFSPY